MIPGPDLPRWGIAVDAWRVLIENSGTALRNAVLPFLILVAMHRLLDIAEPEGFRALASYLLFTIVFPIPAALLLVPWYRLILSAQRPELAERPAQWWYMVFMLRTLGLELMLFATQIPSMSAGILALQDGGAPDPKLAQIGGLLFLLALVPGFYLYGRAGLALPAAAGGHDHSYSRSWRATGSAGWRIAGILIVVWFPFFIVDGMLAGAAAEGTPPGFLDSALRAAIDVIGELVLAAVLALVYLHYDRTPVEDVFS